MRKNEKIGKKGSARKEEFRNCKKQETYFLLSTTLHPERFATEREENISTSLKLINFYICHSKSCYSNYNLRISVCHGL